MKSIFTLVCVIAALFLCDAHAANAQTKRKTKPVKAKKQSVISPKTKASRTTVDENPVVVTQIDFEKLKNLLKRDDSNPRPLLINFWATWCEPCQEEFPELVAIDRDFKSNNLNFITISLDFPAEIKGDVPKFLKEMKATMPAYLLRTPNEDEAIKFVAPNWNGALPFTVLFDSNGKLVYTYSGIIKPAELRAEIEKQLKAAD